MDIPSVEILQQSFANQLPEGSRLHIDGAIWNQWINPLAISVRDTRQQTLFAYIDRGNRPHVAAYDHKTRQVTVTQLGDRYFKGQDDHDAPCIVPGRKNSQDPITVFWTGHNKGNVVKYRQSEFPEDTRTFGPEQELYFSSRTSYVQGFRHGTRILLITRLGGLWTGTWVFRYTTDGGATWSEEQTFVSGSAIYMIGKQSACSTEMVRIAVGEHPVHGATGHICVGALRLDTGDVCDADGNVIANLFDPETLPIDKTSLTACYKPEPGQKVRLFDVGGEAWEVTLATYTGVEDAQYLYALYNGSSFDLYPLGPTGIPIENPIQSYYFGGAFLANYSQGRVWLSREVDGTWYIEEHLRPDLENHVSRVLAVDPHNKLFRPVPVQVYDEETVIEPAPSLPFSVYWCRGGYRHYSGPKTLTRMVSDTISL